MIENGHLALERRQRRLQLERLKNFSTKTPADALKQELGETNNWDSPSLQSCNSHLSNSHLSNSHLSNSHLSSQSTALRSLQPPDLALLPLMQVFLTPTTQLYQLLFYETCFGHQNESPFEDLKNEINEMI